MKGRHRDLWRGGVLAVILTAGGAQAGEFTLGFRVAGTDLDVSGSSTISGESMKDRGLLSAGYTAAYRWPKGLVVEAAAHQAVELFGNADLEHYTVAAGWQYDWGNFWRFTPKAGLAYSELSASQSFLWSDDEPVDKFSDLAPFVEVSIEGRIARHFGIGVFARQVFERFGDSDCVGFSFSWTFL
jgi:hypothetical protein